LIETQIHAFDIESNRLDVRSEEHGQIWQCLESIAVLVMIQDEWGREWCRRFNNIKKGRVWCNKQQTNELQSNYQQK